MYVLHIIWFISYQPFLSIRVTYKILWIYYGIQCTGFNMAVIKEKPLNKKWLLWKSNRECLIWLAFDIQTKGWANSLCTYNFSCTSFIERWKKWACFKWSIFIVDVSSLLSDVMKKTLNQSRSLLQLSKCSFLHAVNRAWNFCLESVAFNHALNSKCFVFWTKDV